MSARLPITFLLFTLQVGTFCEELPKTENNRAAAQMALEVRLDGTTLFKTTFPLRRAERGTIVERPRRTITFSFKPQHAILWMRELGHTVRPVTTKPLQEIEGSIWIYSIDDAIHPGAGSDWFAVGGSFYSDDRTLANLIHIAHPKRRDNSEIAPGLVVLTYPVK